MLEERIAYRAQQAFRALHGETSDILYSNRILGGLKITVGGLEYKLRDLVIRSIKMDAISNNYEELSAALLKALENEELSKILDRLSDIEGLFRKNKE